MDQPDPRVMLQISAMRAVIETLLETMHRLAPDRMEQALLDARGVYLRRRADPTGDPVADLLPELALEILESAIGDPAENLTSPD